jgi:hypothetical protein
MEGSAMMGRQDRDQRRLFYAFNLDEMVPADHLLRRLKITRKSAVRLPRG